MLNKFLIIDLKNWWLGESGTFLFVVPSQFMTDYAKILIFDQLIDPQQSLTASTPSSDLSKCRDLDCFSSPLPQASKMGIGMTILLNCSNSDIWQIPPKHAACPRTRSWNEIKEINFIFGQEICYLEMGQVIETGTMSRTTCDTVKCFPPGTSLCMCRTNDQDSSQFIPHSSYPMWHL